MKSSLKTANAPSILAVHLAEEPPVGYLCLDVTEGLTAFYGENGVGKSRLLESLRRLSDLMASTRTASTPEASISLADSMYKFSGLHLYQPFTEELWSSQAYFVAIKGALIEGAATAESPTEESFFEIQRRPTWAEVVQYVRRCVPFEISEHHAEYLLSGGRWLVSTAPGRPVFLCDPDPIGGPLADNWMEARDTWRSWLKKPATDPTDRPLGESFLSFDAYGHHFVGPDEELLYGGWALNADYRSRLRTERPPELPPLPTDVGVPYSPSWRMVAPPVAQLGLARRPILAQSVREETDLDLDDLTRERLSYFDPAVETPRERERRLWFQLRGRSDEPVSTADQLANVCRTANQTLARLFESPPFLRADLTPPAAWFKGDPVVNWLAVLDSDRDLCRVRDLGSAHRRFVGFAIQRALHTGGPERHELTQTQWAFIDEPEAALHPSAVRYVADELGRLGSSTFVATHSPLIIDQAERVIHVTRDQQGWVRLASLSVDLGVAERQAEARRLGMTVSDLSMLTRVVLLVEGAHDSEVMKGFLGEDLRKFRVLMLPLQGTRDIPDLANAEFLFHTTVAPIVVCVDRTVGVWIESLRNELARTTDKSRQRYLLAQAKEPELDRQGFRHRRSPEECKLIDLLGAAVEARRLDRIHTYGLRKADIVEYLDVSLIRPGATSWEDLKAEFLAEVGQTHMTAGDGARFKKFVGPNYSIRGIREALFRMGLKHRDGQPKRPKEFERLAELLKSCHDMV